MRGLVLTLALDSMATKYPAPLSQSWRAKRETLLVARHDQPRVVVGGGDFQRQPVLIRVLAGENFADAEGQAVDGAGVEPGGDALEVGAGHAPGG